MTAWLGRQETDAAFDVGGASAPNGAPHPVGSQVQVPEERLPGGVKKGDVVVSTIDFSRPNGEHIRKGDKGIVKGLAHDDYSKVVVDFPNMQGVHLKPKHFTKQVDSDSGATRCSVVLVGVILLWHATDGSSA